MAGLAIGAWAPLVPYAKARAGIDAGTLGLLLLALGAGSLLAMPVTGALASRFGVRTVVLASGIGVCMALPWLAWLSSVPALAVALFAFGAAVGLFDVAVNLQAVAVERDHGRPLMSGFHAFFSLGGIAGAAGVAGLLWSGATPTMAAAAMVGVLALLLAGARGGLLDLRAPRDAAAPGGARSLPGAVLAIGALCFLVFMAEGAMLDWSALLLHDARGVPDTLAGLGYAAFAAAMSAGRLTGDAVVRRLGARRVFPLGAACAAIGLAMAAAVDAPAAAFAGFVLMGLGAANLVPIMVTAAGRIAGTSAAGAVAAITTMGYAGLLAGPAVLGWIADAVGLPGTFALLACALAVVALSSRRVA